MAFGQQTSDMGNEIFQKWKSQTAHEKISSIFKQFNYVLTLAHDDNENINQLVTYMIDSGFVKDKLKSKDPKNLEIWLNELGRYLTYQDPIDFITMYELVRWEYINVAVLLLTNALKEYAKECLYRPISREETAKLKRKMKAVEEVHQIKAAIIDIMDDDTFRNQPVIRDHWKAAERLIYCDINVHFDDAYKGQLEGEKNSREVHKLLVETAEHKNGELAALKKNYETKEENFEDDERYDDIYSKTKNFLLLSGHLKRAHMRGRDQRLKEKQKRQRVHSENSSDYTTETRRSYEINNNNNNNNNNRNNRKYQESRYPTGHANHHPSTMMEDYVKSHKRHSSNNSQASDNSGKTVRERNTSEDDESTLARLSQRIQMLERKNNRLEQQNLNYKEQVFHQQKHYENYNEFKNQFDGSSQSQNSQPSQQQHSRGFSLRPGASVFDPAQYQYPQYPQSQYPYSQYPYSQFTNTSPYGIPTGQTLMTQEIDKADVRTALSFNKVFNGKTSNDYCERLVEWTEQVQAWERLHGKPVGDIRQPALVKHLLTSCLDGEARLRTSTQHFRVPFKTVAELLRWILHTYGGDQYYKTEEKNLENYEITDYTNLINIPQEWKHQVQKYHRALELSQLPKILKTGKIWSDEKIFTELLKKLSAELKLQIVDKHDQPNNMEDLIKVFEKMDSNHQWVTGTTKRIMDKQSGANAGINQVSINYFGTRSRGRQSQYRNQDNQKQTEYVEFDPEFGQDIDHRNDTKMKGRCNLCNSEWHYSANCTADRQTIGRFNRWLKRKHYPRRNKGGQKKNLIR